METALRVTGIVLVSAVAVAFFITMKIAKYYGGNERMYEISVYIHKGAVTFLKVSTSISVCSSSLFLSLY